MSTYKVIQNVEAEDKLIGPLTLRQFIYAGVSAICLYLSFLAITKGAAFMLAILLPVAFTSGFFAFPWGQDQPTEIWALAKLRFLIKPRRRVWDQSGIKDLVTVTVPKHIARNLTNGLNQDEVQSRLNALASTIDSRGWAIKNVNVNMLSAAMAQPDTSDRLVQASSLPQEVVSVDVSASDDMMDATANPIAQHFTTMIDASTAAHRQQLVAQMNQPNEQPLAGTIPSQSAQPPADYWFMNQAAAASAPGQATFVDASVVAPGAQQLPATTPQAAMPTADEEAMVEHFKAEHALQTSTAAYGHMKTLKTPEQLAEEAAAARAQAAAKPTVTPQSQAAIINLANNDDLDVATIARQAHKQAGTGNNGEVVISLR